MAIAKLSQIDYVTAVLTSIAAILNPTSYCIYFRKLTIRSPWACRMARGMAQCRSRFDRLNANGIAYHVISQA
jgi:hypothetical protein